MSTRLSQLRLQKLKVKLIRPLTTTSTDTSPERKKTKQHTLLLTKELKPLIRKLQMPSLKTRRSLRTIKKSQMTRERI